MSDATTLNMEAHKKLLALSQTVAQKLTASDGPFTIEKVKVKGVEVLGFSKGPPTLREYFQDACAKFGNLDNLVYEDERFNFKDVARISTAFAAGLVKHFGVEKGDRVAIFARNWPEWCLAFVAITSLGAVAVPLNGWWGSSEVEYGLQNCGAKVVICDAKRHRNCHPCLAKLDCGAVLIRDGPFETPNGYKSAHWDEVLSLGGSDSVQFPIGPDDAAAILYTSGSTGHPKGVVQSHRGICNQMKMHAFARAMGNQIMTITNLPKPTLQASMICPVPLFHVTACHHLFLHMFGAGGKITIMERWNAGKALMLIEREKATSWTGVPTMVQDLMEHPDFTKRDLSSLKSIGAGGAPTPKSQVYKVNKAFKMVGRPSQGYGLTETNGAIAHILGDAYVMKPTSTGKPFPIVEAKCVDLETGETVGVGERGELLVRSTLVMTEYWNNPKATAEALTPDRWFRTGDIAIMDDEGFIHIVDRAKQIIIRGGENISCAEVEAALTEHPSVMEVSIFGLPEPRLGEKVGAMVMLKPNAHATPEDLHLTAKRLLASFKVPATADIYLTNDPLPRGATGKIQKREIREMVLKKIAPNSKL